MRRARLTLAALLLGVGLVACGDDTPACAAPTPKPVDALRMPSAPKPPPPAKPPAYKPPAYKPPAYRSTTRPTSWKQHQPPHTWGQPYGKGRPVPARPTVVVRHQHEYRTYPGYVGYYPIGVWPIGYGETYGCRPLQEGHPEDD